MVKWLLTLATVCVLALPCAVILYRLHWFSIQRVMLLLTIVLVVSVVVFLVSQVFNFKWRVNSPTEAKLAVVASCLCLIPIIALANVIVSGSSLPKIHNISTDVSNPPQFNAVVDIRSPNDNPLAYDSTKLAKVQQVAYPMIKTLYSDSSLSLAFDKALNVAGSMGWQIVYQDKQKGTIEATDTTLIWGFKDDIVIRLQTNNQQTVIDLRSVSRVGLSDLGANAKRIRNFMKAFDAS